jgi:ribonuclease-3
MPGGEVASVPAPAEPPKQPPGGDLWSEAALEASLGHVFTRRDLLREALTHSSRAEGTARARRPGELHQAAPGRRRERRGGQDNERLEFLGDAVLGLVAAEWLFHTLPTSAEGRLGKLKAFLVSEPVLAARAREVGLGTHLRLGVGEERTGGRDKPSLLADGLEAVFGALLVDGGLEAARRAIVPMLEAHRGDLDQIVVGEPKTELQEEAQRRGWPLPVYRVAAEEGPAHEPVFRIECWLLGEIAGVGAERSKKRAEQQAALAALTAVRAGHFGLAPSE